MLVDGKKVNIPSYRLKPGQKISLREKSKNLKIVDESLEAVYGSFDFVSYDKEKNLGVFARLPERNEVLSEVNEQLIVEFYNR